WHSVTFTRPFPTPGFAAVALSGMIMSATSARPVTTFSACDRRSMSVTPCVRPASTPSSLLAQRSSEGFAGIFQRSYRALTGRESRSGADLACGRAIRDRPILRLGPRGHDEHAARRGGQDLTQRASEDERARAL